MTNELIPPPETSPPLDDVRAALCAQVSDQLYRRANRYARKRMRLVRDAGRRVDRLYARELVQDAISDTWRGVLRWDPSERSLLLHVRDVIRQRTWNDAIHMLRHPHIAIDEHSDDGETERLEVEMTMKHASQGDLAPILLAAVASAVAKRLAILAAGRSTAEALARCWAAGVFEREDVLARTGLTTSQYAKAREFLIALAPDLPPDLQRAALDLLRSAS